MRVKNIIISILQVIGAAIGFLISLVISDLILPIPQEIAAAAPASGFLPVGLTFFLNGIVNAVILVWAARRSLYKGLKLWAMLFVVSFVAQVFMTQIETGYFLYAFPLLQRNFELYRLILRGLITSGLFTLMIVALVGGFFRKPRSEARFSVTSSDVVNDGWWLPFVYIGLYLIFGYYVAWQSSVLRTFYSGSSELLSFFAQWGSSLMAKPELLVFQYFRGVMWMVCLIPLFKGFVGKRKELAVLSGLALGLLPTMQLAFANPLMPAEVSLYHFYEVSISTAIYGAICAWFVPKEKITS